jgi:hypothetical protein
MPNRPHRCYEGCGLLKALVVTLIAIVLPPER